MRTPLHYAERLQPTKVMWTCSFDDGSLTTDIPFPRGPVPPKYLIHEGSTYLRFWFTSEQKVVRYQRQNWKMTDEGQAAVLRSVEEYETKLVLFTKFREFLGLYVAVSVLSAILALSILLAVEGL